MTTKFEVLQPSGILDAVNGNNLRLDIIDLLAGDTDIILVDLQDITFMNSSGIGALMAAFNKVRVADKKLYLCSPNEQIKLIFEITQVNLVFKIFADRDDFFKRVDSLN